MGETLQERARRLADSGAMQSYPFAMEGVPLLRECAARIRDLEDRVRVLGEDGDIDAETFDRIDRQDAEVARLRAEVAKLTPTGWTADTAQGNDGPIRYERRHRGRPRLSAWQTANGWATNQDWMIHPNAPAAMAAADAALEAKDG